MDMLSDTPSLHSWSYADTPILPAVNGLPRSTHTLHTNSTAIPVPSPAAAGVSDSHEEELHSWKNGVDNTWPQGAGADSEEEDADLRVRIGDDRIGSMLRDGCLVTSQSPRSGGIQGYSSQPSEGSLYLSGWRFEMWFQSRPEILWVVNMLCRSLFCLFLFEEGAASGPDLGGVFFDHGGQHQAFGDCRDHLADVLPAYQPACTGTFACVLFLPHET